MSNDEMILSTIKKVYAIRASIERRTEDRIAGSLPVIGYVLVALAGTSLSRDQIKDVSAFITATCTTPDSLSAMEMISAFKAKSKVHRPLKTWLADFCLFIPLLLVIAAEAYMFSAGLLTQPIYLAVALLLVVAALVTGLVLFSVIGYDADYRREVIEHKLWKLMNTECKKKQRQNLENQKKAGQSTQPNGAQPATGNKK